MHNVRKGLLSVAIGMLSLLTGKPFAALAQDQVVFRETFANDNAGWTANGSVQVAHDPAGGVEDGGLRVSFPATLLPMIGAILVDGNASGGAFIRDYRTLNNPQLRFSLFFETKRPAILSVALRGASGNDAIWYVNVNEAPTNAWHTFVVNLSEPPEWGDYALGEFVELLSNPLRLDWTFANAGITGESYRLDNVELVEATSGQDQDAGTDQGDEDSGGTDSGGTDIGDDADSETGGQDTGDGSDEDAGTGQDDESTGGSDSGSHQDGDSGDQDAGSDQDQEHDGTSGEHDGGNDAGQDQEQDSGGELEQERPSENPRDYLPANDAIVENRRPVFSWPAVGSSTWHRIQLHRNGASYRQAWIEADHQWQPLEALDAGDYTWRVQGWSEGTGYSAWSPSLSFTIPGAGDLRVQPVSPVAKQTSPDVVYRWSATFDAGWYNLQVERDGVGIWHDAWHVNDSPFDARALLTEHPSGTYRWRVRSWSPYNMGPWSETLSFTVEHEVDLSFFQPSIRTNQFGRIIRRPYTPAHPSRPDHR